MSQTRALIHPCLDRTSEAAQRHPKQPLARFKTLSVVKRQVYYLTGLGLVLESALVSLELCLHVCKAITARCLGFDEWFCLSTCSAHVLLVHLLVDAIVSHLLW